MVSAPQPRELLTRPSSEVIFPGRVAVARPVQQRHQEGRGHALDRHAVPNFLFVARHRVQAVLVDRGGPARKYGVEQFLLGAEIVVDEGGIDPAFDGDGAHRHAVEAVEREQLFGCIEDDGRRFPAALGPGTAADRPGLARLGGGGAGIGSARHRLREGTWTRYFTCKIDMQKKRALEGPRFEVVLLWLRGDR
jgi:hypothetical protein